MPTAKQRSVLAERERCYKDPLYLAEVLGFDGFTPEVHRELFDQFFVPDPSKAWAEQTPITKRMILWPRGHFKTTAVVVFITQLILNFPDIRILIMQGSLLVTKTLLNQIRMQFTGEALNSRLQELFPEFCSDRLGTTSSFTVPARKNKGLGQATVTVASTKSLKTGQHYDIGFFDDLVNESNYMKKDQINKLKEQYFLFMPLIDPPFYAVITGTRYAFGDLYEDLYERNKLSPGWKISIKTCFHEDGTVRFPQFKGKYGKMHGFTRELLEERHLEDPVMYSAQYLNRPVQRGEAAFSQEMMDGSLVDPSDAPELSQPIFVVDLASSQSMDADETVILVGKQDQRHNMWVVEIQGGRWLPETTAQYLIKMALRHRPVRIMIEKTPQAINFVAYLNLVARESGIFLPVDFLKSDHKADAKDIRIFSLVSLIRRGTLKFFRGLANWKRLCEEFVQYGGKAHDDYPDVVAMFAVLLAGETAKAPVTAPTPKNMLDVFRNQEKVENALKSLFPSSDPDDGMGGFNLL